IKVNIAAPLMPQGKLSDMTRWFYAPLWKQASLPEHETSHVEEAVNTCWLVFADADGFSSRLVKTLAREGRDLVSVLPGAEFARVGPHVYTVNPRQRDDYDALLKDLRAQERIPKKIVHMWSAARTDERAQAGGELFERAQEMGCYSLLLLVQSLAELNFRDDLQLIVVSGNAQEVNGAELLCPERATILAACKVIPQEYPHITCRSVDLDLPATGSAEEHELLDQLRAEVSGKSGDAAAAYRGRRRWVENFQPLLMEGVTSLSRLKQGGVYLITGGLGRKGLLLAGYLARTVQAKIILTGRRAFPGRDEWETWLASHDERDEVSGQIRRLREMEETGAEIVLARADVANRQQMQGVIERASERFGQLNGVIHAAVESNGVLRAIEETETAHCAQQFRAKAYGLFVLAEVLRGRQLDFCVLMSSLSSVLGGLGFYAVAAANTFMDAFASEQNRKREIPWASIAWDGWSLRDGDDEAATDPLDNGITAAEGCEVFARLMSHRLLTPVVVSTGDLSARIAQWVGLESIREKREAEPSAARAGYARPALPNPYVAPANEIEIAIAEIWQALLGIEQVGVQDNLFELGGDSLLVIQIVSRIREVLQVEVPLRAIFETPTIADLAASINISLRTMHDETEKIAETLNLVEQLSDEELLVLLSEQ
ncbi:MAG TPA: SDR family oxidoreductase, partial [Pyrinomonadaceae bacterium]|nr:SDR family oxidoreductase [Pyrinomonadaceae bacterium]